MAELNEVFIFSKDLYKTLPIDEGRISIYGVKPTNIFEKDQRLIFKNEAGLNSIRGGDGQYTFNNGMRRPDYSSTNVTN